MQNLVLVVTWSTGGSSWAHHLSCVAILTIPVGLTWRVANLSVRFWKIALATTILSFSLVIIWRIDGSIILKRTFLLVLLRVLILLIHLLLQHIWILVVSKPFRVIRVTLIIPDSRSSWSFIPGIIKVILSHGHFPPVTWTTSHIELLLVVVVSIRLNLVVILVDLIRCSSSWSCGVIVPWSCVHVRIVITFQLFLVFRLGKNLLLAPFYERAFLAFNVDFATFLGFMMVMVIIALLLFVALLL